MTQLVELQAAHARFTEAGIALYAISYDELGALADFAGADTTTMDTSRWLGVMVKRGLETTPDPDAAVAYLQRISRQLADGPAARPESPDPDRGAPHGTDLAVCVTEYRRGGDVRSHRVREGGH